MNPYLEHAGPEPGRRRLPTREQLAYAKELMLVVLLALAFPWLVAKLLTSPRTVLVGAGRPAVK